MAEGAVITEQEMGEIEEQQLMTLYWFGMYSGHHR